VIARMVPRIEVIYRELEAELGPDFTGELYTMLDRLVATLESEQPAHSEHP